MLHSMKRTGREINSLIEGTTIRMYSMNEKDPEQPSSD